MNRKITFNTGRYYSKEGQIIEAEEHGVKYDDIDFFDPELDFNQPNQWIIFHDKTRGIKGKIVFCRLTELDIMSNYDRGLYTDV